MGIMAFENKWFYHKVRQTNNKEGGLGFTIQVNEQTFICNWNKNQYLKISAEQINHLFTKILGHII